MIGVPAEHLEAGLHHVDVGATASHGRRAQPSHLYLPPPVVVPQPGPPRLLLPATSAPELARLGVVGAEAGTRRGARRPDRPRPRPSPGPGSSGRRGPPPA